MIITIGIDYGAGASKIKFVATGITYNFQEVDILDEYDLKSVYDPEEIYRHFIIFIKECMKSMENANIHLQIMGH